MNYYQFHIGDYAKASRFLTKDQDLFYRRMIDEYYDREGPLPTDPVEVANLIGAFTPEEVAAVQHVLGRFFTPTDEGWWHSRCDEEIRKYQAHVAAARENGKLGGRPPKKTQGVSAGLATETQPKGNQEPLPNNQEPKHQKTKAKPLSGKPDGSEIDPAKVIAYLNEKAGTAFKPVRANLDLVRARVAEGFSRADIRRVIDRKCAQWKGTEREQYLRPKTLFAAANFGSYAGEVDTPGPPSIAGASGVPQSSGRPLSKAGQAAAAVLGGWIAKQSADDRPPNDSPDSPVVIDQESANA